MKITIFIFSISLLFGCGGKEKKQTKLPSNAETLAQIDTVVGIGKVIPEDGWAVISAPVSGKISSINVREGDVVTKGQLLIQLAAKDALIIREQETAAGKTKAALYQVDADNLKTELAALKELKEKYETSQLLYNKNAETRERLLQDESNWKQQQGRVLAARAKVTSNRLAVKEQQLAVEKAEQEHRNFQITAAASGSINELKASLGQTITPGDELGTIINTKNLLVEAEVDELMADKVRVGQSVIFKSSGNNTKSGTGTVSYVSPALMDKSIFYETMGEATDRRVRRLKIKPNESSGLLINTKIECYILIK